MFALARETGWSRNFILWELSLSEVLQYNHCALRAMNCWTMKPIPDAGEQVAWLEGVARMDTEVDDVWA